jgi:hypothetical protein
VKHLSASNSLPLEQNRKIDCDADPIASLTEMLVGTVQAGRIAKGQ